MSPAGRRAERAEALAQRELAAVPRWLWDGTSLPVPIESIAENHYGMLVEERHSLGEFATDTDAHVSGVLLRASGRILVDALEAARAPGRKCFTIAHELGHLVLHGHAAPRIGPPVPSGRPAAPRRSPDRCLPAALAYPAAELEANQFAAAMLMPASLVRAARTECPIDLAARCGVSQAAAQKRVEYLCWRDAHKQATRSDAAAIRSAVRVAV